MSILAYYIEGEGNHMITRRPFSMHSDSCRIHYRIIKRIIITGKIYRVVGDAIRAFSVKDSEAYRSFHETAILP